MTVAETTPLSTKVAPTLDETAVQALAASHARPTHPAR